MEEPAGLPQARARSGARGSPPVSHGPRIRPAQCEAAGRCEPRRGGAARDRDGGPRRRRGPPDRHVFEGHAPTDQAGRRAGPRPADPAARRAVQRHGSASAPPHDRALAVDGRRGADDPVLLAHPRGGRTAGRFGPRHLRRPARRLRRLPVHPPAHDRPHTFTVRSSNDRRLAAALLADPSVFGAELYDGVLSVRTSDFGTFTRSVPRVARDEGISLFELLPSDDSLESVFSYLVRR
jgi:hypothetical protein